MSIGSTSSYFHQSKDLLSLDRERMATLLEIKGFAATQIDHFYTAFDYFCLHPSQYDGATASQDLYDLRGLEFAGMLHDWMYISLKAHLRVKAMRQSDKVMKTVMRNMCKSGAEITWRMWRLAVIRRPFAIYNQVVYGFKAKPNAKYINQVVKDFDPAFAKA